MEPPYDVTKWLVGLLVGLTGEVGPACAQVRHAGWGSVAVR